MCLRIRWSSIASAALVASACASPKSNGLFDATAGGAESGAGGLAADAGASSDESAGASGAEPGNGGGVGGIAAGGGGVGGVAGAVGNGGVGGVSNAGAGGNGGGSAGTPPLSKCELMLLQANALLQGAQTCSTAAGKPFCTGYTTNECGCKVPVDASDSAAVEKYVKSRDTFSADCPAPCAPCVEPAGQRCQLYAGVTVGVCVATNAAP